MKLSMKWIPALALVSLFACSQAETDLRDSRMVEPGVYGTLPGIIDGDAVDTRATLDPDNGWAFNWEVGDGINIWSDSGTLLIYDVTQVNGANATFDGGGFTLTEGATYYTSYPLVRNVRDNYLALTTTYAGQTQAADGDASHLGDYICLYASATCTDGNTSFQYRHLSGFVRFEVTLPAPMTVTELSLIADSGASEAFAVSGTLNATTGEFTATTTSSEMTLALDNVAVTDGVLNASMVVAPYAAGAYIVRIKDDQDNVYTSPAVSKKALAAGSAQRYTVTVYPGLEPPVAQIGDVTYSSLAAAVAAVPAGTETTITMLSNHTIEGNAGVTVPAGKIVILDLNGKTITGAFDQPTTAQAIANKGTLTITDSSSSQNGTITIDVSDENAGAPMDKNWASNVIRNDGVLTVNAGTIYNDGNGGACYAVDNYSSASLTVNGGELNASRASAIRLFYMNGGSLTINDGSIGSDASYMGVQVMGVNAANGVSVNVNGGTLSGTYGLYAGGGNASWATSQFNITDGVFEGGVGFTGAIPADNIDVSGGEYHAYLVSYGTVRFIKAGRFTEEAMYASAGYLAEGYKFVQDSDMYVVVPNDDPREAIPTNLVYYYWLNSDNSRDGGFYNFYAPFEGPDPVLMDGEFIELLGNIELSKDVAYLEECSFGDPIFKGGTFSLTFGAYDIDLNGYAFPIPVGVSINTDRQTDIFSAPEGYIVKETALPAGGDFTYNYSVVGVVAMIGDVCYASLAEAVEDVPEGTETTITMVSDHAIEGNAGVTVPAGKNVILNLNGKTVTLNVAESKGSQLITNRGILTITDTSAGQEGKLTNAAGEGLAVGSWPTNNYVTNVITNSGTLNMEAGTVENTAQGSICYAVDNNSTSYDATLNMKGGLLTSAGTVVRQFCNSTAKQNNVNVSGGTIETNGSAAIWTQLPGSNSSSRKLATLNITGGVIRASSYAWYDYSYGDSFEAVEYSISGGELYGYLYSYAVRDGVKSGFVTGGLFSTDVSAYCADGFTAAPSAGRPGMYEIVPAEIYYYWFENDVQKGSYHLFDVPFVKNYLCDGEFIELLKDVSLPGDIACQLTGGTFALTFGPYDITKGSYSVSLKSGVSVKTDKQTDIFSAADEGSSIIEIPISDGDFIYQYTALNASTVAMIGDAPYNTLTEALAASQAGDVIKLVKDYDASGEAMSAGTRQFVVDKSVTIDGQNHTLITKQRGFGVGNVNGNLASDVNVTFKDITIENTSSGARCIDTRGKIGTLTLDGVTLSTDGAAGGYTQPLTIGGNQASTATVNITNSTIQTNNNGTAYYAIITFNPVDMTISQSTLKGWACIYAKGPNSSAGSAGSVFTVSDCTLESTNNYSGTTNSFGAIMIADDNVIVNLTGSHINIHNSGDQTQATVSFPVNNQFTQNAVSLGAGNVATFDNTGSGRCVFVSNLRDNSFSISGGLYDTNPIDYVGHDVAYVWGNATGDSFLVLPQGDTPGSEYPGYSQILFEEEGEW